MNNQFQPLQLPMLKKSCIILDKKDNQKNSKILGKYNKIRPLIKKDEILNQSNDLINLPKIN